MRYTLVRVYTFSLILKLVWLHFPKSPTCGTTYGPKLRKLTFVEFVEYIMFTIIFAIRVNMLAFVDVDLTKPLLDIFAIKDRNYIV